jgi:hypothetical protein
MKKQILLLTLCMVGFSSFNYAQHRKVTPGQNPSNIVPAPGHSRADDSWGLKEVRSDKWNDSIHLFTWKNAGWSIKEREFRTADPMGSGLPVSRLYLRQNPVTSEWRNFELDEMDYFVGTPSSKRAEYSFWDTISAAWIPYYLTHYSAPGEQDEYFWKGSWNSLTGKFGYGYRDLYQYDGNGHLTELRGQNLDPGTQQWMDDYKYTNTYTGNLLTEFIQLDWDTAAFGWVNVSKEVYAYDGMNFLTGYSQYTWQAFNTAWYLTSRGSYTNNAFGKPLTFIYEVFNGSAWDTNYRKTYTYQSDSLLTTLLFETYNPVTHTWTNNSLTTNVYSGSGQLQSNQYQLWNSNASTWANISYQAYNGDGNLVENYYLELNFATFAINSGNRYLQEYDASRRFFRETREKWDTLSETWLNYSQMTDTFEDPVNTYYIQELGTLWDGSNWVNDYLYEFYWSYPGGTGDKDPGQRPCFYENPMKAGQPVNCPDLDPSRVYNFELISMKGERVYQAFVNGGSPFTTGCHVAAGNYILVIRENSRTVYRDKVVILN